MLPSAHQSLDHLGQKSDPHHLVRPLHGYRETAHALATA